MRFKVHGRSMMLMGGRMGDQQERCFKVRDKSKNLPDKGKSQEVRREPEPDVTHIHVHFDDKASATRDKGLPCKCKSEDKPAPASDSDTEALLEQKFDELQRRSQDKIARGFRRPQEAAHG